jgi:acyl carrier protein
MDAFLKSTESPGQRRTGSRETLDRIRRVFLQSLHLNLREEDLDYERRLDELAGFDSLAMLEFVTALEKEFGITMEPELLRLDFVRDLPQLAAYIEDRTARVPRSLV